MININWHGSKEQGTVKARAVIDQDFASIGMQVFSDGSDSFTLMAQASREKRSKTPVLYYVYEVQPRSSDRTAGPPYQGAAILRYYEAEAGALRGNYWTSAGTRGEFILRRR
ncbi:Cap15 family cyclic dinucleotide receptor domain-containing protein [Methylobacterium sp. Gmos1]